MAFSSTSAIALRLQFFDLLFGVDKIGHVCIATGNADKSYFKQRWFKWPDEREELGAFIEHNRDKFNVWFGVSLFNRPERKRAYAVTNNLVWADLDHVDYESIDPSPPIVLETSPQRYQAFWLLETPVPPDVAQDYSKRLAYHVGADRSGWDLEQLLRVPFTDNLKYGDPYEVKLLRIIANATPNDLFDELPYPVGVNTDNGASPELLNERAMPDADTLPPIENVLYFYRHQIKNPTNASGVHFNAMYYTEPHETDDWSGRLWRLINICFEMGMSEEEVFVVGETSKCNKYYRDNRPVSYLWREVLKASEKQKSFNALMGVNSAVRLEMPRLVDEDDVDEDSFVAEYKDWAIVATDAPEQYHEISCFVALSAVISNGLALELEYTDNFRPNIWALVLGESTLTRKTTCMRMAMDLITDLDPELLLATDGSAEGLLSGLAARPKRVSIFYKDEISGFFDSINRKDYLAGFPETLTQLYDVPKLLSRLLRKETITVVEPYFLFFGGGIRDKVYTLINDEYVLSGFLPRFLVVSGENDIGRVRRTGPPTSVGTSKKDYLSTRLADLKERYNVKVEAKIGTQSVLLDGKINAELTPQAWDFFGEKEMQLMNEGIDSPWQMLALPTYTRLAFSMLKLGMLVAASRREPTSSNKLIIEVDDLKQAAYYVQKWGQHSLDLIMASGKTASEKLLDRALAFIRHAPEGVTQSQLMQRFHLSSREMKEVRDTLVDRGLIELKQKGRGYTIRAIDF